MAVVAVDKLVGLSFTLRFDTNAIGVNNQLVEVEKLDNSWLGRDDELTLITNSRLQQDTAEIDVTIFRTNRTDTFGFGPVVRFNGIIIEDVVGVQHSIIIEDVVGMTSEADTVLFTKPVLPFITYERDSVTSTNDPELEKALELYPNPVNDVLYINNKTNKEIHSIKFYNTLGELIRQINSPGTLFNKGINVENLSSGMYIIEFNLGDQVIGKKIKVS